MGRWFKNASQGVVHDSQTFDILFMGGVEKSRRNIFNIFAESVISNAASSGACSPGLLGNYH